MNNFDFSREWKFIISETHNDESRKTNLVNREILFSLQILLSRIEMENYLALKKIYNREKNKNN